MIEWKEHLLRMSISRRDISDTVVNEERNGSQSSSFETTMLAAKQDTNQHPVIKVNLSEYGKKTHEATEVYTVAHFPTSLPAAHCLPVLSKKAET